MQNKKWEKKKNDLKWCNFNGTHRSYRNVFFCRHVQMKKEEEEGVEEVKHRVKTLKLTLVVKQTRARFLELHKSLINDG